MIISSGLISELETDNKNQNKLNGIGKIGKKQYNERTVELYKQKNNVNIVIKRTERQGDYRQEEKQEEGGAGLDRQTIIKYDLWTAVVLGIRQGGMTHLRSTSGGADRQVPLLISVSPLTHTYTTKFIAAVFHDV